MVVAIGGIGWVLGLAVFAALGWIATVVGRRLLTLDRARASAVALDIAEQLRDGAAAARPIAVDSPAQIEPRVERHPCPRCGGNVHVQAHEVDEHGGAPLRRVLAKCGGCGATTTTWFHVRPRD